MVTVTIHQPQYIPWLGYFDKMDCADVFVYLDNVQYIKNEFKNRNRIKSARGPIWLTVPVNYRFPEKIMDVTISQRERWQHKHWQSLISNYRKAPYFNKYRETFIDIFERPWSHLSTLNIYLTEKLKDLLGISTKTETASSMNISGESTDRLIAICKNFKCTHYLAGADSEKYMDFVRFQKAGIKVMVQEFHHPRYNQLFGDFVPYLSVVDLLMNHGEDSLNILRGRKVVSAQ
ncbi:MAG: WbqC family protein [Nitrospinota bacterium]